MKRKYTSKHSQETVLKIMNEKKNALKIDKRRQKVERKYAKNSESYFRVESGKEKHIKIHQRNHNLIL